MEEPKVILIIDDEADIVTMLKGLLTRKGYCVLTALNGKEGLQKITQTKPHLIILDINMPQMDGATFYEHVYDRVHKRATYPILVLTARANLGELFAKLDVDGFITKPFEINVFLKEIEIILSKRYGHFEEGIPETGSKRTDKKKTPKVLVIEDDQDAFDRIVLAFANLGYALTASKTGVDGLERAIMDPPDMILIKLGLPDLPGDVVAFKLKRMPKTMDIPVIIYRPDDIRAEYAIEKTLCEKIGIDQIIALSEPQVLVKEAERIWRQRNPA